MDNGPNSSTASGDANMLQPIDINHIFPLDLFACVFDFLYDIENPDHEAFEIASGEEAGAGFRAHPLLNSMLVCRAWNNLIKTTPKYWTWVAIGLDGRLGWGRKLREIPQESLEESLEQVLGRSGQLPIGVCIVPDHLPDMEIVARALHKNAQRLVTLTLIPKDGESESTPQKQINDLFERTFPALKKFVIGPLSIGTPWPIPQHRMHSSHACTFTLAAPNLRRLACEKHFIIPHSASYLSYLSLTRITTAELHLPLGSNPIELPQLLELHLNVCEPGELLPKLSTPALQTLIVYNQWAGGRFRTKPPPYLNLRELQWSDVGQETCFREIMELSPNIVRYSNYVFGKEGELDLWTITEPATILSVIAGNGETKPTVPELKEVCLDIAYGAEIDKLLTAIPSIQLLRVLRDPREDPNDDEKVKQASELAELRRKVDWEVGSGVWRCSLG